jgi:enoyl-CoA hydratase/carnithine racemase
VSARFHESQAAPIAAHDGAPLLERAGPFLRVTLNRPHQHNRLDPADIDALSALLAEIADNAATTPDAVRALVITGTGEKTFSSGYTLQAILDELDARFERMLDALETLPIPTIAAFNGSVYGGATDLALCCDIRIGTPGLKMFMPAAKFGLHYYAGGLRRYVSRLGLPAATKLMLTAMTIQTEEMLRIGFLTEVVERESLASCVDGYLEHIARTEPVVVAQMKRHLQALARAQAEGAQAQALQASMEQAYAASLRSDELHRRLQALLQG